MSKYHNSKLVNLMRLVYIPLLVTILIIISMSIFSISLHTNNLKEQYKEEGILIASQLSNQIENNLRAQNYAEEILGDKIRVAAKTILKNVEYHEIDNQYLIEMLPMLDVTELHYMDKDGKILYSTIEGYLDWIPHRTHPLYDFVRSTDTELIENVRPDDKYKKLIKYGAIKSASGDFVQVGIDADIVEFARSQFSLRDILNDISGNNKILNARYIDLDTNTTSYSDNSIEVDEIKIDFLSFKSKNDFMFQRKYIDSINAYSYDYLLPVFLESELVGILNITFSLEQFERFNTLLIGGHLILIIFAIFNLIWFQFYNVVSPIFELESNIKKIDVTNNTSYTIPMQSNKTFYGIVKIINDILEKTYSFIFKLEEATEKLEASHEELSATNQQLMASEEMLRNQYDEIIEQKKKIEYIAFHDDLTNLPNRQGFIDLVDKKIHIDTTGAVILIDIDNFKGINDILGHDFGDKVLLEFSKTIDNLCPDNVLFSRIGGDEFLIYISEYNSITSVETFIHLIQSQFLNSLIIEDKNIYITVSMGCSLFPIDAQNTQMLIMCADSAMYEVKEHGKNSYLFFNRDMVAALKNRAFIEIAIRESIDKEQFRLVYQPQVSLSSGNIIGFEALIRMKNDQYYPDEFIPIAEELGSIVKIGRWVAKETIKQISLWRSNGIDIKPVAINFSPKQIIDKEYPNFLKNLLEEYNLSPSFIEIEITENILIDNMDEVLKYLNEFRKLNIKMALDDFGTGFSSIRYLSKLPIDKLKLDKSMTSQFLERGNENVLISIIQLAHCFNLSIVAEGVEDLSTALKLKKYHCDHAQGYYFSKPVESDCIQKLYQKNLFKEE